MSHKAGADFFKTKREWSVRKDLILGDYLAPYLPKIGTQRRPVVVVDGFAGPGIFGDQHKGSPLIIAEAIRAHRERSPSADFKFWAVERDPGLFLDLKRNLEPFKEFAVAHNSAFTDFLPAIEQEINRSNIFLYLDPFTVSGLSWSSLDRVFSKISRRQSIEVLLNFNVFALGRAACAATKHRFRDQSDGELLGELLAGEAASTVATIDDVMGSREWQQTFRDAENFAEACKALWTLYIQRLEGRFAEVCYHEIKEKHSHAVPKYVLVFGSRHPDALELMNDSMAKSLERQASSEQSEGETLFEMRPITLVPPKEPLRESILARAATKVSRGELILSTIRKHFGQFRRSEIRGEIAVLIKSGRLKTESGKHRVNDDELVWTASD